ncbi:MAG: hypothetical protein H3C47_06295 [Candidatus Cloacimonetes bacterium]|nr:hypothetical protein [Candidatus Cloacimonadota bacterium]
MAESGLHRPKGRLLIEFLINRSLEEPDGRPLYAYHITENELQSLKIHLANTNSLDQAAEVVLYGSWFYCRHWKEGRASYDSLIDHLQLAKSAQIATLVRRGLQFWKVRISEAGDKDQLLYSMIYSGGFPPVQLLKPNPLRRFVLRLLERMETIGSEWQYLRELICTDESSYLPQSLQHDEVLCRLGELAQAIHQGVSSEQQGQPEITATIILQKLSFPSVQQETLQELLKSLIDTHRVYVSRVSLSLRLTVALDRVHLEYFLKMPQSLTRPGLLQKASEFKRSLPVYLNRQIIAHLRPSGNELMVDRFYTDHPSFRFQPMSIRVHAPTGECIEELCGFPTLVPDLPLVFLQGKDTWSYAGQKNIVKTRCGAVLLLFQGDEPILPVRVRSQLVADHQCHWVILEENHDFMWKGIPFSIQLNAEKEESEGYFLIPGPEELDTSMPVYSEWPELKTSHPIRLEDLALCRGNESQYIPYSNAPKTSGLYRLYLKGSKTEELRRFIFWPKVSDLEWEINSENQLVVKVPDSDITKVECPDSPIGQTKTVGQYLECKIPLTTSSDNIRLNLHFRDDQFFELSIPAWHPDVLIREATTKRLFKRAWDYLSYNILPDLEFLNRERTPSGVRIRIPLNIEGFDDIHLSTQEGGLEIAAAIGAVVAAEQFKQRDHMNLEFMNLETNDKGEITICGSDMNLALDFGSKTIEIKEGAWLTMPENQKQQMRIFCTRLDVSEESITELTVQNGSASFQHLPAGTYTLCGELHGQIRADYPDPLVIEPETDPDGSLASLMRCYPVHAQLKALTSKMDELLDNPQHPDWPVIENTVQAMRMGTACSIPWVRAIENDWNRFCVAYMVFRGRMEHATILEQSTPVCFASLPVNLWWEYLQKYRLRQYPRLITLPESKQHELMRMLLNDRFDRLTQCFPWLAFLKRNSAFRMPETFTDNFDEEADDWQDDSFGKARIQVNLMRSRVHCAQLFPLVLGDKRLLRLLPDLEALTRQKPALKSYYFACALLAGAHFYEEYDLLSSDIVKSIKVLRNICPPDFDQRVRSGMEILNFSADC